MSQPTPSNGIATLEDEFGGQVFNRTTRRIEVSAFGHQLLPLIEGILHAQSELRASVRSFHQPDREMIRVGLSPLVDARLISICIEPFLANRPQADVFFKECFLDDMEGRLDRQHIDLIVRPRIPDRTVPAHIKHCVIHTEDLFYLPKMTDPVDHLDNTPVTVKDIQHETLVLTVDGCGLTDVVSSLFKQQRQKLKTYAGQAMSYQTLADWSNLGIGAAILPASRIGAADAGRAKPLMRSKGESAQVDYEVYWLGNATYPDHIRALHSHFEMFVPSIVAGMAASKVSDQL